MEEEWRAISDYEGLYEVSNMGNVKSLYDGRHKIFREKILRPRKDIYGYLQIGLSKEGERKKYKVHRLVLSTFSPIENMCKLDVNHIDENKLNNALYNLEWCDRSYNINHGTRNKRAGEKNSIPIAQLSLEGKFIKAWKSSHDAKREGSFDPGAIIKCCKNKFNREGNNIYKGYRWCYLSYYISQIDPRIKKVILFGKEYYFNN